MILTQFLLTSNKVRSGCEDNLIFSFFRNSRRKINELDFAGVTLLVARLETRDESTVADNGRGRRRERLPIIPRRFFDWPYLIAIADEIAHPWCRKAFSRSSCIISAQQLNVLLTGANQFFSSLQGQIQAKKSFRLKAVEKISFKCKQELTIIHIMFLYRYFVNFIIK